jgi:hypothetical protein
VSLVSTTCTNRWSTTVLNVVITCHVSHSAQKRHRRHNASPFLGVSAADGCSASDARATTLPSVIVTLLTIDGPTPFPSPAPNIPVASTFPPVLVRIFSSVVLSSLCLFLFLRRRTSWRPPFLP